MKALIAKENILAYPDLSRNFTIDTEAPDVQLDSVIMQEGKPLASHSIKVSKAQKNHTTTENNS